MSEMRKLRLSDWLPIVLAALGLALLYALVAAFYQNDVRIIRETTRRQAQNAASSLENSIAVRLNTLNAMRSLFLSSQIVTADEFAFFARETIADVPGIQALQWVDEDNIVRYIFPLDETNKKALNFNNNLYPNRLQPILRAKEKRKPVATEPIQLVQGFPGVILYYPIYRDGRYIGAAVGVLQLQEMLSDLRQSVDPNLVQLDLASEKARVDPISGRIYELNGKEIVGIGANGKNKGTPNDRALPPRVTSPYAVEFPIRVADQTWTLGVSPTNAFIAASFQNTWRTVTAGFAVLIGTGIGYWLLRRQQEILRSVINRESEFVSLVSHQLRTPITQTVWLIEALESKDAERLTEKQREYLEDLKTINSNNAKLIDNLLNVSRIERGILKADLSPTRLKELVRGSLGALQSEIQERNTKIEEKVGSDLVVSADALKATEAIRNILDNAVKYAPEGSRVRITAEPDAADGFTILKISDNGPGIPKEYHARLFEKYTSASGKRDERSGAGIGLYLTKQFMLLMGGDVWFETSARGTIFSLRFRNPTS